MTNATVKTSSVPAVPAVPDVAAVRQQLREFGAHYRYDISYVETLLDMSPAAHAAFAAAQAMSRHRVHLPLDVHFVSRISAMRADDCGACTQLLLRMAVEAGVDRGVLRTLLDTPAALPPLLRLAHEHATQVVRGENADPEIVLALRKALGDAAFAELCVGIVGGRIYPTMKRALGAESACRVPSVDF